IGSAAMCAITSGSAPPPAAGTSGATIRWPNVRWSTKRSSRPSEGRPRRIRRCRSAGPPSGCTSSWPLIPRCARSASPESRVSHMYLPRRSAETAVRPARRSAKSAAPAACRRTERGCSTSTGPRARPTTHRSRPARTTSTSGSSGTSGPPLLPAGLGGARLGPRLDRLPRRLGGLLLGLLLAAALARAVLLAGDAHRGAEGLLVVGAALVDVVLGHPEHLRGGQLLQRGLPVQPGAEPGGGRDERVEQPVHQLGGGVQAEVQVDRADQRLQGVGEDGGLVPAAGALLAAAQPDELRSEEHTSELQ